MTLEGKPRPIEARRLLTYPEHASVFEEGDSTHRYYWHRLKPDAATGRTGTPLWGVMGPFGCAVVLYDDGGYTVTGLYSGRVTPDDEWLDLLDKEFSDLLFNPLARRDMDRRVTKATFETWKA